MSNEEIGQKPAYSVYEERDTYRDLCVELLQATKDLHQWVADNCHAWDLQAYNNAYDAITKAEKILGENNAT